MCVDHFTEIRADIFDGEFVQKFFPSKWDEVTEVPGVLGVDGGIELHYRKSKVLREKNLYWKRRLQPDKGHYGELDAYADALLNDRASPVDEIDGARATYLARQGLESIRRNQAIELRGEEYFLDRRRAGVGR
jgi:predicted dehydrogenase